VLASEMEAAHLFVLGAVHGGAPTDVAAWRSGAARVRCAALLAVIGTPEAGIASLDEETAAEERLIDVGLGGVAELARRERGPAARVSTLDHVSIAVTSLARSRAFYDAALAPLGIRALMHHGSHVGYGRGQKPELWLVEGGASYHRPEQLAPITPVHVALAARSRAEVDAFHAAALGAGGTDFGRPGPRPEYHARYYGAFVLDPDGHNVEAVIHGG
jgi:catechol 2,3-dioxygenase-like lactoylglutathione lyase family enzyme